MTYQKLIHPGPGLIKSGTINKDAIKKLTCNQCMVRSLLMKEKLNLEELFYSKYDDEYLYFDRIENKLSKRPDIHAFLLLDLIAPNEGTILSTADHYQVYLNVDLDKLAENATQEQIRDLIRCGVSFHKDNECLIMFV